MKFKPGMIRFCALFLFTFSFVGFHSVDAIADCAALNGTTENFAFQDGSHTYGKGVCTGGPPLHCVPSLSYGTGGTQQAALDILCGDGTLMSVDDGLNGTCGHFYVTPAADPTCSCRAVPDSTSGFICALPASYTAGSGNQWNTCGIDTGTWTFSSCIPKVGGGCPNWNGANWIDASAKTLDLLNCGGQGMSGGGTWPPNSYLDPWLVCGNCNNGGAVCATACIGGGDPSQGTCSCPLYGSADWNAMSVANQNVCCTATSSGTPAPLFSFTNPVDLGTVYVGQTTAAKNMVVSNSGTSALTGCTLTIANTTNFTLSNAANCNTIPAGGSCTAQITGTPPGAATYSTNVAISCSGSLSGSSPANGISMNGSLLPTADLSFNINAFDFQSVINLTSSNSLSPSQQQHMVVTNNPGASGVQTASGCTLSVTNTDFTISNQVGCNSIVSGGTCTFDLDGTPQTLGAGGTSSTKSTAVTIFCSGAGGGSATTTAGGMIVTSQSWPVLTLAPMTFAFGDVVAGTSTQATTVTISNSGSLTASNCTPAISDTTDFQIANNNCATIPGNSTCTFDVKATPPLGVTANYSTSVSISCTNTTDGHYNANTYSFTAATAAAAYTMRGVNMVGIPGEYDPGTGMRCPTGYEVTATSTEGGIACRPIAPSTEFYKKANAFSDGYPVCGSGRLPVTYGYGLLDVATSGVPDSTSNYTYGVTAYTYQHAKNGGVGTPNPVYLYANMSRCVCGSKDWTTGVPTTADSTGVPLSTTCSTCTGSAGLNRFVSDLYDTIVTQTSTSAQVEYATVPIAANNISNGYTGDVFAVGGSSCGCPNFNEVSTPIDPSFTTPTGSICAPNLVLSDSVTNNYKVLTTYSSNLSSQVINPGAEILTATTVKLPTASGAYQTYKRRIWTCAPPMVLDTATRKCKFVQAEHACDDGTSSGTASVVSTKLTGSGATRFRNAVNKKLACCMNSFDPSTPTAKVKFDCIDNSTAGYTSFDALWSGADSASDGAQPNAIALSNSAGQLVTGFYTLSGQRCPEFSEFAGTITSAKVNQQIVSGQQTLANGSNSATSIQTESYSISTPSGISSDTKWTSWLSAGGKTIPTTAADMRRCPVLARAAIVATCPTTDPTNTGKPYPALPAVQNSYKDGSGVIHCTTASTVQVHLRVEQIYEITGQPRMKPIDSVLDTGQTAAVSVTDMIQSKTVGACPTGTKYQSDGTCAFQ